MVLHGSPGVVLGGGLGVPHITGVSSQLARLAGVHHVLSDADLSAGGVDKEAALLEVGQHVLVEQALCTLADKGTMIKGCC